MKGPNCLVNQVYPDGASGAGFTGWNPAARLRKKSSSAAAQGMG
jgi:hypothetical protein